MNPNSAHQLWSRWTTTATVPFSATHASQAFAQEVRLACARVHRALFGSVSELHVSATVVQGHTQIVSVCRTEGAPAPDLVYRRRQIDELGRFFGKNLRRYGRVQVHVDVHVEAGDAGDGKPPAQLIIGPPVALLPRSTLMGHR